MIYGLLGALAAVIAAFFLGIGVGEDRITAAQARDQQQAELQAHRETQRALDRTVQVGQQRERTRAAIDTRFRRLAEEAAHDAPDPVDRCVLPDDRLRRWSAANVGGANQDPAAGQRDGTPAAPAAPALGGDARSGGQPPRGDAALPPAGGQPLQPAAVAGDQR